MQMKELSIDQILPQIVEGSKVVISIESDIGELKVNELVRLAKQGARFLIREEQLAVTEEPEPVERPKRGRPKCKEIDKGRVLALHSAGWTQRQIADDVGCAQSMVSTILSKVEDEENGRQSEDM